MKKVKCIGSICGLLVIAVCGWLGLLNNNTYTAMSSFTSGTATEYTMTLNVVVENEQKMNSSEIATDIMAAYTENELEEMLFDFENGYPTDVNVNVYLSEEEFEEGVAWFCFHAIKDNENTIGYNITL